MALRSAVNFQLYINGDGSSTAVTVTFASAPFILIAGSTGQLPTAFSLSALPPAVVIVTSTQSGIAVTPTLGALNLTCTFTYASALGAGVQDIITGTLEF